MTRAEAAQTDDLDSNRIRLHGPEDFDGMRKAGRLAAATLDFITPYVVPGVTTGELDVLCEKYIRDHGAVPAPLGYRGYPKATCISINHVVCHGIPGDKRLRDGDILNIDVTVILDGWFGDTSRMFLCGETVSIKARKLVDVTYEALMLGIAAVRPGATLGDIGYAIQRYAEVAPLLDRARLLRPRPWPGLPRCAERAPLRPAGPWAGAARGHVLHDRADGQCRAATM